MRKRREKGRQREREREKGNRGLKIRRKERRYKRVMKAVASLQQPETRVVTLRVEREREKVRPWTPARLIELSLQTWDLELL